MAGDDTSGRDETKLPEAEDNDQNPDAHLGAVEGDRPGDPQHSNANLPALDADGLPRDLDEICEDVIGANADESQG